MKRFIFFITACILLSCSFSNPYDEVVKECLIKGSGISPSDIKVNILELKELTPVTVKDSIEILKDRFEKQKQDLIDRQEQLKKLASDAKERAQKVKIASSVALQEEAIRKYEANIDSIRNSSFTNVYEGVSPGKVLLHVIDCRYVFKMPVDAAGKGFYEQEERRIFYLSPDKKDCMHSSQ